MRIIDSREASHFLLFSHAVRQPHLSRSQRKVGPDGGLDQVVTLRVRAVRRGLRVRGRVRAAQEDHQAQEELLRRGLQE